MLNFVFIVLVRACRVGICCSVFILLLYRFSLSMEMSRLTRDGTAKPLLRDQILTRVNAYDRKILIFPVQLTTCRNGNLTGLILMLVICVTIQTYIVVVVVLSAREFSPASLALFFIS